MSFKNMSQAKLIISDSEKDSNMFYATGISIPDDFIFLEKNNHKMLFIDALGFSEAKKEARVDKVINYLKYDKEANRNSLNKVIIEILKENRVKKVLVPENFKMKYAKILMDKKIAIEVKNDPFFAERVIKNKNEITKIEETQRAVEKAVGKAIKVIKNSKIRKDKKIEFAGKILTVEFINETIDIELLKNNCKSDFNIVFCGAENVDPHQQDKGPLRANESIVIDVFPKSTTNRYYADMTRTVVKGKASPKIKKIYQTVLEAQKLAISNIKPGTKGSDIHKLVDDYFINRGFKTKKGGKKIEGFFHGTGHGLGLDIHEFPALNAFSNDILQEGNIVTIEPGLYYPKIGGARIEDMVLVTKNGCENLTNFPKFLEV